jgi:hypothetical protein
VTDDAQTNTHTAETHTDNSSTVIRVRDRRQKHQFSVHNRVIDQWLPIVGQAGYALYSLYVRMANNDDERCYPGYTTIGEHLGVSPATISNHNKLLVWCQLLHIEPGNQRKPNDYYILDVPAVTPETLDAIRRAAAAELPPNNKFRRTVFKRLDKWQPIQAIWDRHKKSRHVIVVHPNQLSLFPDQAGTSLAEHPTSLAEQGTSLAEHPTSLAEQGTFPGEVEQSETTIRKDNPHQHHRRPNGASGGDDGWTLAANFDAEQKAAFDDLLRVGVRPQAAAELVRDFSDSLGRIQSWIDYTEALAAEGFEFDNLPGFLVAGLRRNEAAMLPQKPYRYDERR